MDYVQLINNFGIPVAASCALAMFVWRSGQWVAKEIVIPLRDRHFAFLVTLEKTLETIATAQRDMTDDIRNVLNLMQAGGLLRSEQDRPSRAGKVGG